MDKKKKDKKVTLNDLGLTVEDYLSYIRGTASEEINEIIDKHWNELEIIKTKKP